MNAKRIILATIAVGIVAFMVIGAITAISDPSNKTRNITVYQKHEKPTLVCLNAGVMSTCTQENQYWINDTKATKEVYDQVKIYKEYECKLGFDKIEECTEKKEQ